MAALLLEQRRLEPDPGERHSLLDQVRAELTQLRAEVAALRRDNLELRQQAGYWQSMHTRALERLDAVAQDNEHLRGQVARLNAQLFGQKSEKQSRKDRSNHLEGLDGADDTDAESKPALRPREGPQRRDYRHLPAREELVELPEAQQLCPRCGQPWRERSDTEDSEQIEIEVKAVQASVFFASDVNNPDTNVRFLADLQTYTSFAALDPQMFMAQFVSWELPSRENKWTGRNLARWRNEHFDRLWRQADVEMDPVKRAALFIRMNDLVVQQGVVIPITWRSVLHAAGTSLAGIESNGWDSIFGGIAYWYRQA
jgi:hypothetical protein